MRKKSEHKLSIHRNSPQDAENVSIEPNLPPKPINEITFNLINQRASGFNSPASFGVAANVEAEGFESFLTSWVKAEIPTEQHQVIIGGPQCKQPYAASMLNCSALSFGPMGKHFILALNKAAYQQKFFQNTGEAGLSPYHFGIDIDIESPTFDLDAFFQKVKRKEYPELAEAGDLVWQIGNGYFGCRGIDGHFDPMQFQQKATIESVKMIEIKLSQGAEPCKKMPVKQVTPGMTKIMGIRWDNQAKLQASHSSFSSPLELVQFANQLRSLSSGKPIGVKLGISHRHHFMAICKAMLKTGILLDFITVDGMEAGTAAAPAGALGFTGTPLNDALLFVHNALVGANLRQHIKIIASGKVFTERDIVSKLARGADLCSTARGMMVAVGCDQQLQCHLGTCPRGIATQDPTLLKNFNIASNIERLCHYHQITTRELAELVSLAGLSHPSQIRPSQMQKRISAVEIKTLDEIYTFLKPGALLSPFQWRIPHEYRKSWAKAHCEAPFTSAT